MATVLRVIAVQLAPMAGVQRPTVARGMGPTSGEGVYSKATALPCEPKGYGARWASVSTALQVTSKRDTVQGQVMPRQATMEGTPGRGKTGSGRPP